MTQATWFSRNQRTRIVVLLSLLISACGGGGGEPSDTPGTASVVLGPNISNDPSDSGSGTSTVQGVTVTNPTTLTISGSVIDGPVINATITIRDAVGELISTTYSNASAHYTATIPAQTRFPLTLTATDGVNIVTHAAPTFTLESAVLGPEQSTANISPFTTLIVKTARKIPGGLIQGNLNTAKDTVLTIFNAGLDTTLVSNPLTTPVTEQNIATIIKASEALAETIRRNQTALQGVIANISQNDIINSLSADMTDGELDGNGDPDVEPRVSSITSITFGQVLIETLSNTLRVNNEPSMEMLSNAVNVTFPTATQNIDNVPITMGILSNTRTAIAAAALVAPNLALADVENAVNSMTPGSQATEIAATLPADASSSLDAAISMIATADETLVSIVNTLVGTAYAASSPAMPATEETLLNIISASASSYDTARDRSPGLAIDGNLDTKWTALSMPQWFVADLGAVQTINRLSMKIYVADAGANTMLSIETSTDNQTWTTGVANEPLSTATDTIDITLPSVNARYLRLNMNSTVSSDYINLSELMIFGQVLPAVIASASASSYDASRERTPELVVDGNLTSKWTALSMPQWLTLDLGSVQSISGVNMKIYVADAGANANYSLDVSADQSTWTPIVANSALDTSSGWVQASFSPVNGRYLRLRLNSTNTSDYVNLSEFMVYAQALPGSGVTVAENMSNIQLNLSWQPSTGTVHGYKVFFGPTAESAITELADITNVLTANFNPALPLVQYDSWYTLRMLPGDNVCFKVRAYNADGLSDWSLPICGMIAEAAG